MLQRMYNGSTKRREKGAEKLCKKVMAVNFTNSLKNLHIWEFLQNPVSSKHKEVHKQICHSKYNGS